MVQPRAAKPTIRFIDEYCEPYRDLFIEVRSFEAFKHLHVGMISEVKRKSLPAIAKVTGLPNSQSLQHFLCESPWSVAALRERRLELILQAVAGRKLTLIIDETGDRKKGRTTDYVKRQYLGNLGKVDNGIVAVTAYGLIENITLPLCFEIYKPKERLKPEDTYRTKPEIAAAMIRALCSSYALAIRSNHAVWLPKVEQRVRHNRWREYTRTFSDGTSEQRYIREIIYGRRRTTRFWQLTTDKATLP